MLFPRLHPELELCHCVPVPGWRNMQTSARQGVPNPGPPARMAPDKGTLLLPRALRGLGLAECWGSPWKSHKCCRQAVTAWHRAGMISDPHAGYSQHGSSRATERCWLRSWNSITAPGVLPPARKLAHAVQSLPHHAVFCLTSMLYVME